MITNGNSLAPNIRRLAGVTLLELLVTLSIIAILTILATPSLVAFENKTRADALIFGLRDHIYFARQSAISQRQIVTLCPLASDGCGSNWSEGYRIFSDANNNRIIDDEDELLEQVNFNLLQKTLSWKASGGRSYLSYSPNGNARQFGRFHLCNNDADPIYSRALVINRQGKIRMYQDRDQDGIVEDINGSIPNCSI